MNDDYEFDEIGQWSEVKLDIIREYASTYSKIISSQSNPKFHHVYIDAFAGGGKHISKNTGEYISGSPTNALLVDPPFSEYHFIDLDRKKAESLNKLSHDNPNTSVYNDDCNEVLLNKVLPQVQWERYKRALCILDPYKLDLDWKVIEKAGHMRSIEIFLNFPVMDMNRTVLWKRTEKVSPKKAKALTRFWGDESWREIAYEESPQQNLFGNQSLIKKDNDFIAEAFRKRLKTVAGFKYVIKPIPMKNTMNSTVYYLFFASQKPVAKGIVQDIFNKYSS